MGSRADRRIAHPHLLEETHEVVDAIRDGEPKALEGELGDLLLNLAFQIVVAEEDRSLDAESVYRRLEAKMVARHPHLFGSGERRSWESLKAEERKAEEGEGQEGVLTGLAKGLDPLTKALSYPGACRGGGLRLGGSPRRVRQGDRRAGGGRRGAGGGRRRPGHGGSG